jgi:hypothetical protein
MQKQDGQLPTYLNLDTAFEDLQPNESPFIKGMETGINANPDDLQGSANPLLEGQNVLTLTPTRSNIVIPNVILPAGYNKNVGSFESILTQELYQFNFNGNGDHGIYILDGNSGVWYKVIVDPTLNFSDDQDAFIAEHRVRLRIQYDNDRNILEKFLIFTDGNNWQKWINVIAATKTNGFDASLYPYWSLRPPHFDRRELLEWATRPCMYNPIVAPIPNVAADTEKVNRLIDQAFQFSIVLNNTDGRTACLSPYSLPLIVKSEDFLNNPDNLPKNALLTLYAGSCMTESIDVYVRKTAKQKAGIASTVSWSDWYKYDRIYKFSNCGVNGTDVIGTEYWLRSNPWSDFNYDPNLNTIQYIFDNSKLAEIVDQVTANRLQNDLPNISVALTDMGDAALLGNNQYGYDNLDCSVTNNLSVEVVEKQTGDCIVPLRKIRLYAYVGRSGNRFSWESQVGYYFGADTQMRFGGMQMGPGAQAQIGTLGYNESKYFTLDFADKNAFRVYLKGTPYYADGTWYQVNADNSLTKLSGLLDGSNNDVLTLIQNVFIAQGYFVCVFDLEVPAGRYIATLGRHNVASSDNYRSTSTYIMGLANSRLKTQTEVPGSSFPTLQPLTRITPAAIGTYIKEQELDCTSGDIDVWGNGQDLFYVFCPFENSEGNNEYRFIEGYFQESQSSPLGVEMFPYGMNHGGVFAGGQFTDKNGFYFAYTMVSDSNTVNIEFTVKINCSYPHSFEIITAQAGSGWRPNPVSYLSDNNLGVVGDCNRILLKGTAKSLDGTIEYSNIAISIVGGQTVYSDGDGNFTLVIHNGQSSNRVNNVYINAGGSFLITIADCGQLPLYNFNEALAPCINCQVRTYPIPINLLLNVQGGTGTSLKENGVYSIGLAVADLAGRLGYVNVISNMPVPSFLTRDDVLPTFFRLFINNIFKFNNQYKWAAPYVSPQLNVQSFIQWVGDSIQYIDNSGNVVSDPSSAVFCSIAIDSLYNYNAGNNFSLLAAYQFSPEDRIRILDDGNGQLFDVATYGEPIDLQILGTNYNQAAMTAGIIPNNSTVPIINNQVTNTNTINTTSGTTSTTSIATQQNNQSITLYVRYDSRLDKLIGNSGFWIELYTPQQEVQEIKYNELEWHPIINGSIADFEGFSNGQPVYNYPLSIDIDFWDTYLFSRDITIPKVGSKFFSHPFESSNISDSFGANVTSGGRQWIKNDNAKQLWYADDVIKSDNLTENGIINGLGTFRSLNRKDFTQFPFGGINVLLTQRSIILFVCENDFFTTTFNFHFTYPNAQGVMITNLGEGLSTPSQKVGDNYGLSDDDHSSVVVYDKWVFWWDRKNEAFVLCDYQRAIDISDITDEQGRKYGIKSYAIKKTQFVNNWNLSHDKSSLFDVLGGVDITRKNIIFTFRPRRQNTNDLSSYVNQRRNLQLNYQESVVYNIESKRWLRFVGYTPESYGKVRGNSVGVALISFSAGIPYSHNQATNSFLNFYGQKTEPVLMLDINKDIEFDKVLQTIAYDSNLKFFVDLIYSDETNSYSYIPTNYFERKENQYYSETLRNLNSYPPINPELIYLSMLQDGKRVFGTYFLCRLVGDPETLNQYFQMAGLYYSYTYSPPLKK